MRCQNDEVLTFSAHLRVGAREQCNWLYQSALKGPRKSNNPDTNKQLHNKGESIQNRWANKIAEHSGGEFELFGSRTVPWRPWHQDVIDLIEGFEHNYFLNGTFASTRTQNFFQYLLQSFNQQGQNEVKKQHIEFPEQKWDEIPFCQSKPSNIILLISFQNTPISELPLCIIRNFKGQILSAQFLSRAKDGKVWFLNQIYTFYRRTPMLVIVNDYTKSDEFGKLGEDEVERIAGRKENFVLVCCHSGDDCEPKPMQVSVQKVKNVFTYFNLYVREQQQMMADLGSPIKTIRNMVKINYEREGSKEASFSEFIQRQQQEHKRQTAYDQHNINRHFLKQISQAKMACRPCQKKLRGRANPKMVDTVCIGCSIRNQEEFPICAKCMAPYHIKGIPIGPKKKKIQKNQKKKKQVKSIQKRQISEGPLAEEFIVKQEDQENHCEITYNRPRPLNIQQNLQGLQKIMKYEKTIWKQKKQILKKFQRLLEISDFSAEEQLQNAHESKEGISDVYRSLSRSSLSTIVRLHKISKMKQDSEEQQEQ